MGELGATLSRRVESILAARFVPRSVLGKGGEIDRSALREDLKGNQVFLNRMGYVLAGVLLVLLAFEVWIAARFLDQPKIAEGVFAALGGLSVAALLGKLQSVARETTELRLLSALALRLDEQRMAAVVERLLKPPSGR